MTRFKFGDLHKNREIKILTIICTYTVYRDMLLHTYIMI